MRLLLMMAMLSGCTAAATELQPQCPAGPESWVPENALQDQQVTEPEARRRRGPKPRKRRQLRVMTVNGNSWGTVKRLWPKIGADADVVLIQEVKLRSAAMELEKEWLRGLGWQLAPSACLSGPQGGASAGVAVAVRQGIELMESELLVPGRAMRARIRCGSLGPVDFYAVYAKDSLGMEGGNLDLYDRVMEECVAQGLPFLIGGDHNMPPRALAKHMEDRFFQAVMLTTDVPTMVQDTGEQVFDFFSSHVLLAAGMRRPQVLLDYALVPHRPVVVELCLEDFADQVLLWKKPKIGELKPAAGTLLTPNAEGTRELRTRLEKLMTEFGIGDKTVELNEAQLQQLGEVQAAWNELALEELRPITGMECTPCCDLAPTKASLLEVLSRSGGKRRGTALQDLEALRVRAREAMYLIARRAEGVAFTGGRFRHAEALAGVISKLADSCGTSVHEDLTGHIDGIRSVMVRGLLSTADCLRELAVKAVESVDLLQTLVEDARRKDKSERQASWEDWAAEACAGSASKAFRFIKGGGMCNGEPMVLENGVKTSSPYQIVQAHGSQWAKIWGCG